MSHRTRFGYSTRIHIIEKEEIKNKSEILVLEEFWTQQFKNWGFKLKNGDKFNSFSYIPKDLLDFIKSTHIKSSPIALSKNSVQNSIWDMLRDYKNIISQQQAISEIIKEHKTLTEKNP